MQAFKIILVISLSLTGLAGTAQQNTSTSSLDMGYFGQFLIQPGIRIGKNIPLHSRQKFRELGIRQYHQARILFLQPSLGYYQQFRTHRTLIFSVDVGYTFQKKKPKGHAFHSFALGLGYQLSADLVSYSVSLSDGSITDRDWVNRQALLPMLSYTHGFPLQQQLSAYYRLILGQAFEISDRSTASLFAELGLRYYFTTKTRS